MAPPINKGILNLVLSISLAIVTISSRLGVIKPERPITSASQSFALDSILSTGTITPRSIISYPLQPKTTPTIFFPIS